MLNFQKIIDILSNAFSILDFSYIISGGLTLSIILFDLYWHGYHFFVLNNSITLICGLFFAYVCGLVSWTLGKFLRRNIIVTILLMVCIIVLILFLMADVCNVCLLLLSVFCVGILWLAVNLNSVISWGNIERDFSNTFDGVKKSLDAIPNLPVFGNSNTYTYMWIELCNNDKAKDRVVFINRMWVMQAMFEGLIFSFITGIFVLIDLKHGPLNSFPLWWTLILCFLMMISTGLSMYEARKYAQTQIKEVILSYFIYCKNIKVQ